MSTQASQGNGRSDWPGGRRWHASLPALAATLTCLSLVATVGFAGFAARQLALATDRQASLVRMREQLSGATEHLERANRLLSATAKVVQAASKVQDIDQAMAQQRTMAEGLAKTTQEAIAAAKADKALKGAARDKSIAKLNAEMKTQLAAITSKEKELGDERQPLAEELSQELGRMLATFAEEAARVTAKKAPAAPVQEPAAEAPVENAPQDPPSSDVTGSNGTAPAPADARVPADSGDAPQAAPENDNGNTAVRPGRDGTASGIGSGKQVEP